MTVTTTAGRFFTLEGIDGTGKSTLTKDLSEYYQFKSTRMPGGTPFAERLRAECRNADISDPVQILFYSALILDCHESLIAPTLQSGQSVISDRGFGSTFAYQSYGNGHEKLLLNILQSAKTLVVPDLTLYIDIDMNVSYEREAAQDRVDAVDRYSRFDEIQKEKIKEAYDKLYLGQTRTHHLPHSFERDVSVWKIRERVTKTLEVINGNNPYSQVLQDCKAAIDKHPIDKEHATIQKHTTVHA